MVFFGSDLTKRLTNSTTARVAGRFRSERTLEKETWRGWKVRRGVSDDRRTRKRRRGRRSGRFSACSCSVHWLVVRGYPVKLRAMHYADLNCVRTAWPFDKNSNHPATTIESNWTRKGGMVRDRSKLSDMRKWNVETSFRPRVVGVSMCDFAFASPVSIFTTTINSDQYQAINPITYIDSPTREERFGWFRRNVVYVHTAASTITFLERFFEDRLIVSLAGTVSETRLYVAPLFFGGATLETGYFRTRQRTYRNWKWE